MNYILNIETSTKNCSVSISYKKKCVSVIEKVYQNYQHAEILHVFIQHALKKCNLTINQIKAICVGSGPGSFTGLRIGITTAKSLCYLLNIPLLSINSLYIMTESIALSDKYDTIIPMISINKKKKYFFLVSNKSRKILTPIHVYETTSENFIWFNKINNLILIDKNIKIKSHTNIKLNIINNSYPSAKNMSKIAYSLYKSNQMNNVQIFEPLYL
jgi:tRNA threonylcarbamoyladenosine biosynthesis protein TsaB